MDAITSTENKSQSVLTTFFSRFLPDTLKSSTLMWACIPLIFTLFSLGIGYMQPAPFTQYLPFLALITLLSCVRFRTFGLVGSYIALLLFSLYFLTGLEGTVRLWQMGVLVSFAANLFIVLLSTQEMEVSIEDIQHRSKDNAMHLRQAELDFQQAFKSWEEEKEAFESEIERLKDEAEQRRIEKVHADEQFKLIQSEIEMLTSQKETLIEEARSIRLERVEKRLPDPQPVVSASNQTSDQYAYNQLFSSTQEQVLTLQHAYHQKLQEYVSPTALSEDQVKALKDARAQAEGLYAQLRLQFEEKTHILSQTRKELFNMQGKVEEMKREKWEVEVHPNREEANVCEGLIDRLTREVDHLEQEVSYLEELVSHILLQ